MFLNTFWAVIIASFSACMVTTFGIYVISKYEKWGNKNVIYFISFAAGVLISVSFIHIIPKAIFMHSQAPLFVLTGFMGMYIINRFVSIYVCHEHDCIGRSLGIMPMIGIGLHSFIDGIIYAVTFNVSIFTGAVAAIGMVLHEFPEGIVTFLLLEQSGFSRKKSVILALIAAAFSTPLGTLVSYPIISKFNENFLGSLLAVSAGALIYVGATHLLPTVEKERRSQSLISLGAGIGIAMLIVLSKGQ